MTRNRKPILWVLVGMLIGLLALSLLSNQALAQEAPPAPDAALSQINMQSANFGLHWNVLGSGGGTISSAHFVVSSTIGQPSVGTMTSTNFEVCTGYWCFVQRLAQIFLPLITRG